MVEIAYFTWNVNVKCRIWSLHAHLGGGVASVGVISIGCRSPYMGQHFRCRKHTGGRHSPEAAIVKRVKLWL